MYTYLVQGYPSSGERFIFRRWEGYDTASHEKIIITQPGSTSTRIAIIDMLDDIMLVFNHATQQLMGVRSPNKIIWMIDYMYGGQFENAYINKFNGSVIVLRNCNNSNTNIINEHDLETGELISLVPAPSNVDYIDLSTQKRWGSYIIGKIRSTENKQKYYYWSYNLKTRKFVYKHQDDSTIECLGNTFSLSINIGSVGPHIDDDSPWLYVFNFAVISTSGVNEYKKVVLGRINLDTWEYLDMVDASNGYIHINAVSCWLIVGANSNYILFNDDSDREQWEKWVKRRFYGTSLIDESVFWDKSMATIDSSHPSLTISDIHRNPGENEVLWFEGRQGFDNKQRWFQEMTDAFTPVGEPIFIGDELSTDGYPTSVEGVFRSSYLFEGELVGGSYNDDIVVPDEYYDTANLKLYIEQRKRRALTTSTLQNFFDIRIANPVEGGTPWFNFEGSILPINWRARYNSKTGTIICTGNNIQNVKNDGWSISGNIIISIDRSYLNSSNLASIYLEIETPNGEWISTTIPFSINNYTNVWNYRWRYEKEDDNNLYFRLLGGKTATNDWYKPNTITVYDGSNKVVGMISSSTNDDSDGNPLVKIGKDSTFCTKKPKHGYWIRFQGSSYYTYGVEGVERFEFTVPLKIFTTTIGQVEYEVTQQADSLYIINEYFTENVEVYKDGVKLEGSYDKESGEIKFILPKDTPQELNGHTLNLQYKVFYNDNDEIKSFMQDFTYTTYASYFVEFDPDFKDYCWEQLSPTPYGYSLYYGCMVSHGDYIYLVGSTSNNGFKELLLRYNIESDTWTELASPEYDVYKTKPVVYNNKIYVIGGVAYSTGDRVTKVQIYDIETDSWSYGTDCPRNQGPHELQPIEYNGKIYCFSGYDYDYPSPPNKMDIYDIETDSWESIETPYNLRRYSASCIDGKIYICNGTDSNYNYITTLYIYDIEANTWTTGPNQPVATNGSSYGGGTMLDKFVVILGDFKESLKTMSFDYDISKNKWMRLPNAPNEIAYSYENAKCCRNNNEFYVLKYQYFYRLIKAPVYYTDSYLYEYEGKYYTENENGELVETTTQELNEDLFLNEGVNYINSDLIKPNTKVLYFKVENKNEVPQLKYSGVYEGTTIVMDWDLQSEQGKTFNVLGDIYSDDNVRFLLSNDNGQTWKTFDGYEVVNCDIDNIKSNGMTYDIFTSLNASQLESFKGGTNSLRIAIYIEQYSVNGKTNIDHIRLRY